MPQSLRRRRLVTVIQLGEITMAAQAGPSNTRNSKKAQERKTNVVKSAKIKKLTEKQRIVDLEKAAMEFVSCDRRIYLLNSLNMGCLIGITK